MAGALAAAAADTAPPAEDAALLDTRARFAAAAAADAAPPAEEDAAPLETRARFVAGCPPSPLGATDSAADAAVAPPSSSSAAAGTGTSNVTMNAGYLE